MPFWMPLTVEVANTAVSSTTTNDCKPALSDKPGNCPAALLSCSDRNPKGPTVPAMAATTERPSQRWPRAPSTQRRGTKGTSKLRGRRGSPRRSNTENVMVTVVATSAQARKPQCKKLTAKAGSTAASVLPLTPSK